MWGQFFETSVSTLIPPATHYKRVIEFQCLTKTKLEFIDI